MQPRLKKLDEIESRISQIDAELEPIEEKYKKIVETCRVQTDNRLIGYLGAWTICTVSIGRLTWWEYKRGARCFETKWIGIWDI